MRFVCPQERAKTNTGFRLALLAGMTRTIRGGRRFREGRNSICFDSRTSVPTRQLEFFLSPEPSMLRPSTTEHENAASFTFLSSSSLSMSYSAFFEDEHEDDDDYDLRRNDAAHLQQLSLP